MGIDAKIEKPTRKMLERVTRGELDELREEIRAVGDDRNFTNCIELCVLIAGYVVADITSPLWPTEAGLREISKAAAQSQMPFEIDESKINDYLKRVVVGFEPLDRVYSAAEDLTFWPIAFAATMMLVFCPRGKRLWEYLDEIEEAIETADAVKASVLPAMTLRAHRMAANKKSQ